MTPQSHVKERCRRTYMCVLHCVGHGIYYLENFPECLQYLLEPSLKHQQTKSQPWPIQLNVRAQTAAGPVEQVLDDLVPLKSRMVKTW
jgi:hypothetical protein